VLERARAHQEMQTADSCKSVAECSQLTL